MLFRSKRVMAAFIVAGLIAPESRFFDETETEGTKWICFPHPSGLSRWWNDDNNRELAGETFARLFAETLLP